MPEPHYPLNLPSREENEKNIEVLNYVSLGAKREQNRSQKRSGKQGERRAVEFARKASRQTLDNEYKGDDR